MPKVDYQRDDFRKSLPKWELVDDCDAGQDEVKSKGDRYLPRPNPLDTSPENLKRYDQYKDRAVFFNATSRTLGGLVGQVFSKEPEFEAPEAITRYEDDLDGGGVSLIQQAKEVLRDALKKGRFLMFTDFAAVAEDTTSEQVESGLVRPVVVLYDAKQVINWRVETVGAKAMLALVVIFDPREVYGDDPFEPATLDTWRVFSLEDGRFVVRVWRKATETERAADKEEFVVFEEYWPLKGNGTPWDEIPATIGGSLNNDPAIDSAPIYDIATLNIAHYRNSADYEESSFVTGQATLALTSDMGKDQFDTANPNGVALGSRGGIFLGAAGSATLIQSQPNSQPFEAMGHKERQMVALGAKLVEQQQTQRTAKEAGIENASETSILASVANNVSEAYVSHLYWMAEYLDITVPEDGIRFQLNTNYDSAALTAELLRELNATWTVGGISDTEYRTKLKAGKLAFEEDEDWQESRDQNPQGLSAMVGNGNPQQQQRDVQQ